MTAILFTSLFSIFFTFLVVKSKTVVLDQRLIPSNLKELEDFAKPFYYGIDKDYILELNNDLFNLVHELQSKPLNFGFVKSKIISNDIYNICLNKVVKNNDLNYHNRINLYKQDKYIPLTVFEKEILWKHVRAWESLYEEYIQTLSNLTDRVKINNIMKTAIEAKKEKLCIVKLKN